MKKFKKLLTIGLVTLLSPLLLLGTTDAATYKIGVLAKRGAARCMKKWGKTADFLTKKTGDKYVIVPLKFTEIEPAVKKKEVDFILANSAFYVVLEKKFGVRSIATLINSRQGKALDKFGGVIFVRSDSPIHTLEDIKGKRFDCVKYSSFGGAHMAWRLLLENGIDPKKDCASFTEGKKHDYVVYRVLNKKVDVGTVRSDTLERMEAEGKIKLSDFRIIHKVDDDFPFVHSTRLYPEWPMAACPHVSEAVASKTARALFAMKQGDSAAKAAKIVGWEQPADYQPVIDCLKAIKYGPFGK
ncbi:MAG TPA: phosphate/phosphite/phosphonate ABC transporter substrate-binding protein [Deltaproteobacteria bacterium]|nr:phosphate/phosphite/phosphonate ABC transporter substrate-binding protein [Deltaproteobacteria bacterium]